MCFRFAVRTRESVPIDTVMQLDPSAVASSKRKSELMVLSRTYKNGLVLVEYR